VAIEDHLIAKDVSGLERINKDLHQPFFAVFIEELGDNRFFTREIRKRILTRWGAIVPKISNVSLKNYLSDMEQKYWASISPWEQKGLTNKIITQTMDMQETIIEANNKNDLAMATKKSTAVIKGNELIAKVARLIDQTPAASFSINISNISEDEMTMDMNKIQDIED